MPQEPSRLGRYRVGDIELDPGRGYIRRSGEDVYLRLQSFELLAYLLKHRDRVVTKDELHQAIWKGVAVGDDAIVQCIADVRRALGDDSRAPRFIRTVPKLGYRFVAPVEELDGARTFSEPDEPSHNTALPEAVVPPSPRVGFNHRVTGLALLAVAVATTAVSFGFGVWPWTLRDAGAGHTTRRVLVLDFENHSGDSDLAWLRHGLADMVITDLSRFDGVSVVSRPERDELLRGAVHYAPEDVAMPTALDLARRSRADLLVLGSFAAIGGSVRLEVRLHDAATGRLLGAEPATAETPAQIFTQVDVLSAKLARRIGVPAAPSPNLAQVMTNNLDAYHYYSLGLARSRELRTTEAIELFEKAIELDPGFAMAYARIGYTYAVRHALLDRAKPYLQRAFEQSARLTDRDRLQIAAWYAIANQDYEEAIVQCRVILERYPDDTDVAGRLATLLQGESRLEEARDVALRAYGADSENPGIVNVLGGTYSLLGRHADAIAMFQRYVALAPSEANAYDSLGLAYQWAGRYGEAIDAYTRALALNPAFEVPMVHLGNTYVQLGRLREAVQEYERYIAAADYDHDVARGHGSIVSVYLARGDIDAADVAVKKREPTDGPLPFQSFLIAAARGDRTGAEAHLRAAEKRSPGRGAGMSRRFLEYLRGRYALLSGRGEDALEHFRIGLTHPPPTFSMDTYEDALGQGYLALGRLEEAVAEFERVLRLNANAASARFGLAQALDRQGQTERARAEYEIFLHLWRDADRDVPQLVTAQRRLTALRTAIAKDTPRASSRTARAAAAPR